MAMVTWEQYSSLYSKVSEVDFDKAEELAEKEVRAVIGPRWSEITTDTYGYDVLQDCICKVMDQMQVDQIRIDRLGVSSVSNGGYSETYGGTTFSSADIYEQLHSAIKKWLSGTGLVGAY